ncbi:MAG: hypothetical protein GY705_02400 [Bacteroidetes bacterium]|nr:hypothetical protein [Bacteroidota bacterium]
MNSLIKQPYKIIWWAIPIVLGISLIKKNFAIDIQMHDTYFIIDSTHAGILLSIFLIILGVIYWLTKNLKLINWMTIFHVLVSILIILSILFFLMNPNIVSENHDIKNFNFEYHRRVNQMVLAGISVWILSQLIFIINLTVSIIRNQRK